MLTAECSLRRRSIREILRSPVKINDDFLPRDADTSAMRRNAEPENKRLQLNQRAVRGVCYSFGAAVDIELGEDAFHV